MICPAGYFSRHAANSYGMQPNLAWGKHFQLLPGYGPMYTPNSRSWGDRSLLCAGVWSCRWQGSFAPPPPTGCYGLTDKTENQPMRLPSGMSCSTYSIEIHLAYG